MATVSSPRIKVTLTKTMDRQNGVSKRFTGAVKVRDLTPWLGEHGIVRTTKSIYEPAGGFTIAFPDKPAEDGGDTLYGLIEPMDLIEIRAGREQGDLPIIMRGFVQRIGRSETIGPDGSPQRVVMVMGHDYGAVLRWAQFNWLREIAVGANNEQTGNPFFTIFRLQDWLGIDHVPTDEVAGVFVRTLVDVAGNKNWLKLLDAVNNRDPKLKEDVKLIQFDCDTVTDGRISSISAGGHEGDLWSFIASMGDLDWNECFMEDREDGPWLIYRPKPWRDAYDQKKYIMPGAKDPGTVKVESLDLRAANLSHSAEGVANWYWVDGYSTFESAAVVQIDASLRGNAILNNENSDHKLFGVRRLSATTMQLPSAVKPYPSEKPRQERDDYKFACQEWREFKRDQLKALHQDNVVFEEGTLTFKGSPKLMIGKYLELKRGQFTASYYAVGVDHTFSPFRDWVTTVMVERGTGFLARVQDGRQPVWLEGRPGA